MLKNYIRFLDVPRPIRSSVIPFFCPWKNLRRSKKCFSSIFEPHRELNNENGKTFSFFHRLIPIHSEKIRSGVTFRKILFFLLPPEKNKYRRCCCSSWNFIHKFFSSFFFLFLGFFWQTNAQFSMSRVVWLLNFLLAGVNDEWSEEEANPSTLNDRATMAENSSAQSTLIVSDKRLSSSKEVQHDTKQQEVRLSIRTRWDVKCKAKKTITCGNISLSSV